MVRLYHTLGKTLPTLGNSDAYYKSSRTFGLALCQNCERIRPIKGGNRLYYCLSPTQPPCEETSVARAFGQVDHGHRFLAVLDGNHQTSTVRLATRWASVVRSTTELMRLICCWISLQARPQGWCLHRPSISSH